MACLQKNSALFTKEDESGATYHSVGSLTFLAAVDPFLEEVGKAAHLEATYLGEAYQEGREDGDLTSKTWSINPNFCLRRTYLRMVGVGNPFRDHRGTVGEQEQGAEDRIRNHQEEVLHLTRKQL